MAGAHNALFVNQALGIYPEDFVDAFVQVFIADVEQVGVIPDFVAGFETLVNQFLEPKDDVFLEFLSAATDRTLHWPSR